MYIDKNIDNIVIDLIANLSNIFLNKPRCMFYQIISYTSLALYILIILKSKY